MKSLFEQARTLVNTSNGPQLGRRDFLRVTVAAGGGLLLAAHAPALLAEESAAGDRVPLNAFVTVTTDGRILIYSANAEMGQGIKTALPMVIAEEMGADWEDVEVLQAPFDEQAFGRQRAGGSTTVNRTWGQMRTAGATVRELFLQAGAIVMEKPRDELIARDSMVVHDASGAFRTFAQLASLAAEQELPDPADLEFKERQDYTILGKAISGVDNLEIATGGALFGMDHQMPGLLYAAYEKCGAIGGTVVSANLEEVREQPGVVDAFILRGNGNPKQLLDGIAIVGRNTWAVFHARQTLRVEWDTREASDDSWSSLAERAAQLHGKPGENTTHAAGDVDAAFESDSNTTLSAFYEYPFVAHLCMEPMNCTADYRTGADGKPDHVELWIPTQGPARALGPAKSLFGLEPEQVTIHQMRLGGSFGRRVYNEYTCEAIAISRHMGAPVKLTWSREDDIRHDFYRVGGFQSVRGAVDPQGRLVAFENHHMGMQTDGRAVVGSGFRPTEFPLQNLDTARVTETLFEISTPCGPWRAPRSNTNAFVVQSFLDEMAHAAGRDYAEFLLEILGEPRWFEPGNIRSLNTGRAADVIRKVVESAGWGRTLPAGHGLGLSFYFSHAAHVAEVAEVSVDANRNLTVHKVFAAVDVGPIINFSGATSQVEGAIVDGLSTMMGQKITFEAGAIEQSNFHNYPVLRMPGTPEVVIDFIESDNVPTGLGEPALPPLAPAVGNAIFAASGERVRKMPLSELGYRLV